MKIYYPIKPVHINQPFGANADYYLPKFGTPGHMGIDFMAEHGHPVYAAHDGKAKYIKDSHGGEGVYLACSELVTNYWHLIGDTDPQFLPPIPMDDNWHEVKAGDLIGYANNTGAPFESTGEHLHMGLALLDTNGNVIDTGDGYKGYVDPAPYFNGINAADLTNLIALERALVVTLQSIVNYYLKLRQV